MSIVFRRKEAAISGVKNVTAGVWFKVIGVCFKVNEGPSLCVFPFSPASDPPSPFFANDVWPTKYRLYFPHGHAFVEQPEVCSCHPRCNGPRVPHPNGHRCERETQDQNDEEPSFSHGDVPGFGLPAG